MRWVLRLAANFPVAACLAVAGCGFAQKPYANDPLLRAGRASWITSDTVQPPGDAPPAGEPVVIAQPDPQQVTFHQRD
ncbi:MAG: hypothetical protein L0241_06475 [Planctomycetia bacterium]|nr:hypothetical protein [Planctomycetia bacterium]